MEDLLNQKQLLKFLEQLKDTLQKYDYSILTNILFFNMESLYSFMAQIPIQGENRTIGSILESIESYIPFGLTEETLDLFLSAYSANTEEEMEEIRRKFSCRSKLDFLDLIRCATKEEDWKRLLEHCEQLRLEKQLLYIQTV